MKWLIIFIFSIASLHVHAAKTSPDNWELLKVHLDEQEEHRSTEGWSYILSGILAGVGGAYGVTQSNNTFTRGVYTLTEVAGISVIGFGMSILWTNSDSKIFYQTLESTSLSLEEKNRAYSRYLALNLENEKKQRNIYAFTAFAAAAVSILAANRESDAGLRSFNYVLAGVNLVAGFSLLSRDF